MIRPFVSLAAAWCLLTPSIRAQVFTPTPVPTPASGSVAAAGEAANPFVHPGLFSSQNELDAIRRRLASHSTNWSFGDIDKFSTVIRALEAQSSRIITRPFNPGSNWGMSAMLGDMAAGVFLDDHAVYGQGRNAILRYMPGIIKEEGWCNEIFRDSWHGGVALTAAIEAAEIGRHQGDLSIYHARYDGQRDPRIAVALRWYAGPLRGIPAGPLPAMKGGPLHKDAGWMYDAKGATRNTGAFEMALNFYTRSEHQRGLDDFRDMVLHFYRPSGQDNSLYLTSDSLTHADLN